MNVARFFLDYQTWGLHKTNPNLSFPKGYNRKENESAVNDLYMKVVTIKNCYNLTFEHENCSLLKYKRNNLLD